VQGKNGEQVNSALADIKVYLDGDDTPEGMVPLLTARSAVPIVPWFLQRPGSIAVQLKRRWLAGPDSDHSPIEK